MLLFLCETLTILQQSSEFQLWVSKNEKEIINAAEILTNHGKVIRIDQYTVQNYVVLDIVMDTSNAAGQNMVTLAAKVACSIFIKKTNQNYFLESNINSDKKASVRNMLLGRGHRVTAETTIKNSDEKNIKNGPRYLI